MTTSSENENWEPRLPDNFSVYYGNAWHEPLDGNYIETYNPGRGTVLGKVADTRASDVDKVVAAARIGFFEWKDVAPLERARILKEIAVILRANARELATIDSANCGNPVKEMLGDANIAAAQMEFFAGLVTEMKGSSIPMGPNAVNFSIRQPLGVVARILAYNHPFMFCGGKMAAPLAAGNSVIIKPPTQAPLSTFRLAELIDGLLPAGVFNVVPGGVEAGAALAAHKDVAKVTLIGSIAAGRAVMRAASETIKPVLLELGGKNALIAFPDTNPEKIANAIVGGMNFSWCGQSCGSTSRAFLHDDIHDAVVRLLPDAVSNFKPGIPTKPSTTMGALVSKQHFDRVMTFINSAKSEGAVVVTGGKAASTPDLEQGHYIEPTIFKNVKPEMRIASEEIFGPVLAIRKWSDEIEMLEEVNSLEYGLTSSIWTQNVSMAHQIAAKVEVGFVWINEVSKHFLGAPFGGVKQSGIGREEGIDELLCFTQEKNIHINISSD